MNRATELEYLQWFFENADFGPADDEVREIMNRHFQQETGKTLPEGYEQDEEYDC